MQILFLFASPFLYFLVIRPQKKWENKHPELIGSINLVSKITVAVLFGVYFFWCFTFGNRISTIKEAALSRPDAVSGQILTQLSDSQTFIILLTAISFIGALLWLATIIINTSFGDSLSTAVKANISKISLWYLPLFMTFPGGIIAFFLMRKSNSKQAWALLIIGIIASWVWSAVLSPLSALNL